MVESTQTESLQKELENTLRSAARGRRIIGISKLPVYLGGFVYFLLVMVSAFAYPFLGPLNPTFLQHSAIAICCVILAGQFVFIRAYTSFQEKERSVIKKIVNTFFPDMKHPACPKQVKLDVLRESRMFPALANRKVNLNYTTFASLEYEKTVFGSISPMWRPIPVKHVNGCKIRSPEITSWPFK